MSKFKVGDRVAVYGSVKDGNDSVHYLRGQPCTVTYTLLDDEIHVKAHDWTYCAHPKQCRRLVKKPRRRVWINPNPTPNGNAWLKSASNNNFIHYGGNAPTPGWIEFIEVKRRK